MIKEETKEEELKDDIGNYSDLEAVANSNGGKIIIKKLKKDIFSLISSIGSEARNGIDYHKLVAGIIALDEKINMYNIFMNASENKKDAQKIFEELMKPEENKE